MQPRAPCDALIRTAIGERRDIASECGIGAKPQGCTSTERHASAAFIRQSGERTANRNDAQTSRPTRQRHFAIDTIRRIIVARLRADIEWCTVVLRKRQPAAEQFPLIGISYR